MEDNLRSLYYELFNLTITLADHFKMTPFEMFAQDCDEVISVINYYLSKPKEETKPQPKKQPPKNDGFWDF